MLDSAKGPPLDRAVPVSEKEFTQILRDAGEKRVGAMDELYPLVYDELRRLAQHQLQEERPDHTLQATALVHEAYLRMVDQTRVEWQNRAHFFAIAAQAIRRILVDHARSRNRKKRGGEYQRVELTEIMDLPAGAPSVDMIELDAALARLAEENAEKVQVVEMRFFAGLTHDEIAGVLGVSTRTVERHWQYARAWLFRELDPGDVG